MELFLQFINEYGTTILYTVLTALFGYFGLVAKKYFDKWFETKEKKETALEVVQFAEQVYKTLHGEEKLQAAMNAMSEILAEKGIHITELEMRVLIEAAVAEFNKAFEKEYEEDWLEAEEESWYEEGDANNA
jgi:tyrosyl-tRNA synthetase